VPVRKVVPLIVLLALLAAGCGARSNTPFTAAGTIACLKSHDFTNVSSSPAKVGFIAGFAEDGGLIATSPANNTVTIAFTKDSSEVPSTEDAFRKAAPPRLRPHISDVTRSNRNAVMVWTTTPSSDDDRTVNACLQP
jgi:hypothetical protein